MVILMAIKTFLMNITGKSTQVLTDNITALSYIVNNGGSTEELKNIARAIWSLAISHNMQN